MLVLNYGVIVIVGVLTVGGHVQTVSMNAMIGMIAHWQGIAETWIDMRSFSICIIKKNMNN
jgi:hypothetical protein